MAVEAITIEEQALIEHVGSVKQKIVEALSAERDIVLDVSRVVEADLAFLQLVEAARLEADRRGGALRFSAPPGAVLQRLAGRAGLLGNARQISFWTGEDAVRDGTGAGR